MASLREKETKIILIVLLIACMASYSLLHITLFLTAYVAIAVMVFIFRWYENMKAFKGRIILLLVVLFFSFSSVREYIRVGNILSLIWGIVFTAGLIVELIRYVRKNGKEKKINIWILSVTAVIFLSAAGYEFFNLTVSGVETSTEVHAENNTLKNLNMAEAMDVENAKFAFYSNDEWLVLIKYEPIAFGRYRKATMFMNDRNKSGQYINKYEFRIEDYLRSNSDERYVIIFGSNTDGEISRILVKYYFGGSSDSTKEMEFKIPKKNFFAIIYRQEEPVSKSIAVYDESDKEITEKYSKGWQ
ncbi:MAG: hypothetical protein Q8930_07340 [Bacillota bacterium]|nr:hypothetical protein [Bacillota bacterium]